MFCAEHFEVTWGHYLRSTNSYLGLLEVTGVTRGHWGVTWGQPVHIWGYHRPLGLLEVKLTLYRALWGYFRSLGVTWGQPINMGSFEVTFHLWAPFWASLSSLVSVFEVTNCNSNTRAWTWVCVPVMTPSVPSHTQKPLCAIAVSSLPAMVPLQCQSHPHPSLPGGFEFPCHHELLMTGSLSPGCASKFHRAPVLWAPTPLGLSVQCFWRRCRSQAPGAEWSSPALSLLAGSVCPPTLLLQLRSGEMFQRHQHSLKP